jgi:hypothetical protein
MEVFVKTFTVFSVISVPVFVDGGGIVESPSP